MDYFFVLKNLFFLFISFWSVYLVGHILLTFFYKNAVNKLFYKLVIGVVLIPTIYAIYKTNGITVLSLNIVVLLMFLYHKRKVFFINSISSFWKQFLMFDEGLVATNVALIVFYFIQLNSMFDLSTGEYIFLHEDYSLYARIATYIRDFGVENRNLEYFLPDKGGVTIYHYSELWLTAFISSLFKLHTQYALYLFTYTILLTVVYSGIVSLIKNITVFLHESNNVIFQLKPIFIYSLSFSFFTFSLFSDLYPSSIDLLKMDLWTASILSYQKHIYVYIFSIVIFFCLAEKKYFSLSILSCLLVNSYTPVAPALFSSIFMYYVYLIVFDNYKIKTKIYNTYPLLAYSLLVLLFYKVFGDNNDGISMSINEIRNYYSTIEAYKTFVNIIGKTTIQILITSSPIIIVFVLLRKKIKKILYVFLLISIFSGLIVWAILYKMHDSVQLWSILFLTNVNIFSFLILIVGIISIKSRKFIIPTIITIFILCFGIINRFPFLNQNSTNKNLNNKLYIKSVKEPTPRFAFIKEKEDYIDYFSNFEQLWAGYSHTLMRKYDPLYIVCLSTNNINVENEKLNRFNKNTTFEKYKEQLQSSGLSLNHEEAQIKFIKEYNIDYLLSYKYRDLPIHLQPYFENQSIGYVDGFSIHKRIDD